MHFRSRERPKRSGDEFDRRCLIATLEATADALEIRNLIYGAESGRLWRQHAEYFDAKERIDEVLLENLNASHQALCKTKLSSDAAQALLIQAMFIAYLEDRDIITAEYFLATTRNRADSFSALLETKDVKLLKSLFVTLRNDFNGDLFVAPCSFDSPSKAPTVVEAHLDVLAQFRSGREEMAKGQFRFWGYNFRYIPIELVSAVYDRFLGEREEERKRRARTTRRCSLLTLSYRKYGICCLPIPRRRATFSIRRAVLAFFGALVSTVVRKLARDP